MLNYQQCILTLFSWWVKLGTLSMHFERRISKSVMNLNVYQLFFVMQRSNIKSYQNSKFLLLISTVYTRYSQKSFFLEIANFSWHSLKKKLFIWYIKINQADKTPFFREQSVYCGSFHLKLFHPLYKYWIFLMIFIWKNVNQILRQPV